MDNEVKELLSKHRKRMTMLDDFLDDDEGDEPISRSS